MQKMSRLLLCVAWVCPYTSETALSALLRLLSSTSLTWKKRPRGIGLIPPPSLFFLSRKHTLRHPPSGFNLSCNTLEMCSSFPPGWEKEKILKRQMTHFVLQKNYCLRDITRCMYAFIVAWDEILGIFLWENTKLQHSRGSFANEREYRLRNSCSKSCTDGLT